MELQKEQEVEDLRSFDDDDDLDFIVNEKNWCGKNDRVERAHTFHAFQEI